MSRMRQSSFPWHFFKTENCFRSSGFEIPWQPFTCAPSMFFNSLMEMTSSVADIICIAQITFKLIYNTLPANDGWFALLNSKLLANFWTREYRLYWIADVVAKSFGLFSDETRKINGGAKSSEIKVQKTRVVMCVIDWNLARYLRKTCCVRKYIKKWISRI